MNGTKPYCIQLRNRINAYTPPNLGYRNNKTEKQKQKKRWK